MSVVKKVLVLSIATTIIAGCNSTPPPPPETLNNAAAFEVLIPAVASGNQNTWNVDFRPFTNGSYGSSSIYNFYKVGYQPDGDNMKFSACNGERYSTGRTYQSCTHYDLKGNVVTDDSGNSTLTLIPVMKTQEKGGLIIDKRIPDVTLEKLYGYLSSQKIEFAGKVTSEYSPESIKGNFDRMLSSYSWGGEADAAHRQFKDSYNFRTSQGASVIISAGFYPYREGSIVQYAIRATTDNDETARKVDWVEISEEVRKKIEQVVKS